MRYRMLGVLQTYRTPVLALMDSLAWFVGVFSAAALRLETMDVSPVLHLRDAGGGVPLYGALILGAGAAGIHLVLAAALRLHQGRHAMGSFEELFTLFSVVSAAGVAMWFVNWASPWPLLPRTSMVTALAAAMFLMSWPRALWRLQWTQRRPTEFGPGTTPVIIAGAGDGGRELVRAMHSAPQAHWVPVAFVDDDPRKKHFRYRGVPVRGTTDDLEKVASLTGVGTLIIAMPSVTSEVISRINDVASAAHLDVKVLPGVHDLLGGDVTLADVRDIEPADLLGRHQVETDVSSIADYLTGRTVLVTGAGGSIGSELCRQIERFEPGTLVMLDRDESALHALALSMNGRADLGDPNMVLADVRDAERMLEVFDHHRPDVVFHAAALKHVNMLERHPAEAVKTNVFGTLNVLEAARAAGVGRFVNISTDKAASPENILGYTKRLAEGLTAQAGREADGIYLSVRFGNVLGTRGSVLTTFTAQIERGGPLTLTDPEVTRYFMTVDEAVQLVIQAAAIGRDGEALVLDMGQPVRILDVAKQMIQQSRRSIEIVYTGLRPGEKLHEVLFAGEESDVRPFHPAVSHVSVPGVSVSSMRIDGDADGVETALRQACAAMADDRRAEVG